LGAIIAVSIFAAWITPTLSLVHDLFASVPFVLLSLYVPMMLFHGERPIAALSTMIIPPLFDLVLFGSGASFGQVQKCNTLVFLALLNLLYYRILPATFPLLHSPYSEIAKPRARSVPASAVAELAIFPPIQVS
jgi:hypothetical protein